MAGYYFRPGSHFHGRLNGSRVRLVASEGLHPLASADDFTTMTIIRRYRDGFKASAGLVEPFVFCSTVNPSLGHCFPQHVDAYNSVRHLIPALRDVHPPRFPLPPPAHHHHHHPPFFSSFCQRCSICKVFPLLLFHANPSVDTSLTSRLHSPRSSLHAAAVGRQLRTSAAGLTGTRRARQTAEGTLGVKFEAAHFQL